MTQQDLPSFEPIEPPPEPAPRKPRRKPMKRRARKATKIVVPKKVVKRRKRRVMKVPRGFKALDNPAAPKEFDVVQSIIKTMLLLDRSTAKSVANLLGSIFT